MADGLLDEPCAILFELWTLVSCQDCIGGVTALPQLALLELEPIQVTVIADTQHFNDALISPDAKYLALTVMDVATTETRIFDISKNFMRIHTLRGMLIREWDPIRNRLLVKDASNNTGIYRVFNLQRGAFIDLPGSQELNIARAVWSPDGQSITYTANRYPFYRDEAELNYTLHVANIDEGTSQQMTGTGFNIGSFFWIAEDRLVYSRCQNDNVCSLYEHNIHGGSTVLQGEYQFIQSSPSGSMSVAVRQVQEKRQLGFLDLNTEAFQVIDPDYTYWPQPDVRWLSWSSDGRYISYLETDREGTLSINIIDTSNALITELNASLGDGADAGYWGRDSDRLILDSGIQQKNLFYVFNVRSNVLQQIEVPISNGYATEPRWICE